MRGEEVQEERVARAAGDAFALMDEAFRGFDRLFENFPWVPAHRGAFAPLLENFAKLAESLPVRVEVSETEESVIVAIHAPGLTNEKLMVEIPAPAFDTVIVSAQKVEQNPGGATVTSFTSRTPLPAPIVEGSATQQREGDVVTITLQKRKVGGDAVPPSGAVAGIGSGLRVVNPGENPVLWV